MLFICPKRTGKKKTNKNKSPTKPKNQKTPAHRLIYK